ncbi:hypothetical protein [Williamsia sp.]|uniref:hypothetical protein n=1 Tax=Williamsia sp. TaxID=1872085 RepID=UPI001A32AC25|nr:hypothetical protein [Williamsia sp.]MBJ7291139.1 hypothetical protein [Williamsia sp.]
MAVGVSQLDKPESELMSEPTEWSRPVRLSDLPPNIARALTRPSKPGEIDALKAEIAGRRGQPTETARAPSVSVPTHLRHAILTPAERQQEINDRGLYQTLDEQIDEWLDENGGTIPPDVLRDIIDRHKAHLASRPGNTA